MSLQEVNPDDEYKFDVLKDLAKAQQATTQAYIDASNNITTAQGTIIGNQPITITSGTTWTTTNNPNMYAYTPQTFTVPANSIVGPYGYAEGVATKNTNLGDLISKCGKNFYYLVSPSANTEGDGMWHAKGKKVLGKGKTPEEAVESMLNQLTTE